MSKSYWSRLFFAALASGVVVTTASAQQDIDITVSKPSEMGFAKPILISVSGFSGEVAHTLNFDLTVMGFKEVTDGSASWTLTGSGNGNVQAQLNSGRTVVFSKAYSGASDHVQTHRLADDVVMAITHVKGIAETKIAYKGAAGTSGGMSIGEIYVSDFDGFNPQAVTRDHAAVAAPCWVPGRMAMYYTSYKLGDPDIFYQNLQSGERQNFAHYGGINSSAAVSPDGRRVAMVLSKTGNPDIFVCDANGGNLKQLSHTREASSPCWSPDGDWICFAARVNGRRSLYKVSPEGGEIQRITIGGVPNPTEPDWSPDGRWIAFTSQTASFSICVVPAQGGTATVLQEGEDPSWSPNSRTLIFVRRGGGGNHLSVLDAPTNQDKDVSRVSGSHTSNSQPSWAR